jgi:hypothetical protein
MNWQALAQRLGALEREIPQSVHSRRGSAAATGGAQTSGRSGGIGA